MRESCGPRKFLSFSSIQLLTVQKNKQFVCPRSIDYGSAADNSDVEAGTASGYWAGVMSIKWIGIADDLTEHGVVGQPYAEASTPADNVTRSGYPVPPKNGQAKTLLMIAGIATVFMLTPPGSVILNSIGITLSPSTPAPAQQPAAAFDTGSGNATSARAIDNPQHKQASTIANQQAATESSPKKKQEKQTQKRTATNRAVAPVESVSEARSSDEPAPAAESEIDLSKYRNLTGRI